MKHIHYSFGTEIVPEKTEDGLGNRGMLALAIFSAILLIL